MKTITQSNLSIRATKTDLEVLSNLIEDKCAEVDCQMSIWVDKDLKEQGRQSRCMPCLIRTKFPRKIK